MLCILKPFRQTSSSTASPIGQGSSKEWHLFSNPTVKPLSPSKGPHIMATSSYHHPPSSLTSPSGLSEPAASSLSTSWTESSLPWQRQKQQDAVHTSTLSRRPKPWLGRELDSVFHLCPREELAQTMKSRSTLESSSIPAGSSTSHGSPRTPYKGYQATHHPAAYASRR